MDLMRCFSEVIEIQNIYRNEGNGEEYLPVDLSRLIEIVGRRTHTTIVFREIDWGSKHIKGALRRYNDRAEILYASGQNPCWERFVVCKELSHLIIDGRDSYTTDPKELVACLVGVNSPSQNPGLNDAETSEYLAEIVATELLFPLNYRRDLYRAYNNREMSLLDIAKIFRIPQRHVERAFSEKYRNSVDPFIYYALSNPSPQA